MGPFSEIHQLIWRMSHFSVVEFHRDNGGDRQISEVSALVDGFPAMNLGA